MLFGTCYYPEFWDHHLWREHARLMADAGMNVVRLADFAWSSLEPSEGQFDFDWLDEAIRAMDEAGLRVILCTPTAAPPRWLARKKDILMRDRYGRVREWGSRRACCANNETYRLASDRIVTALAEHYRGDPRIVAWQIDNELGCHGTTVCYCESCKRRFQSWLADSYGSIRELNRRWGTVFWSQTYDSFEDVILPAYNSCEPENSRRFSHNPSLDMEFMRFSSESWVAFAARQAQILRQANPQVQITTNLMGHFADIDYFRLMQTMDFVSWDNHPQTQWELRGYVWTSMAHEIMRGIKDQNFIVM
ncbi:MAG: beta-galactosidase [Butyrivibrio sp.]|nr:beta-galactosidase [Butyrivibrio sp.]